MKTPVRKTANLAMRRCIGVGCDAVFRSTDFAHRRCAKCAARVMGLAQRAIEAPLRVERK